MDGTGNSRISRESFMKVTFEELQRDLTHKTRSEQKLKDRISTLKTDLKETKDQEKRLIVQYERIIKEWKKRYDNLLSSGWKIVFAKMSIWYNTKRGKKVI